ncbi:MAG: PEP-CTERM sorting domain-containing protein [Betaproteobacteria bacterium]|nr:PEP-CTERM sorting domain-containing protein [Betaproteobacteria bacterium]
MKKFLPLILPVTGLMLLADWAAAQTAPPSRVPEPDSLWLIGIAAAAAVGIALHKRRK